MPHRLARETSPYLRQHADNPVDWWPWCEEALAAARREDRPILLSIGYSACHWCHVMAHESFADPAVAAVMNRHYVNIKVDREERPDLDLVYQSAHQILTGHAGGWPLTLFLVPDGSPFFGGTYFPPEPRYGRPGFVEVLERVARVYAEQRGAIERQNETLRDILARSAAGEGAPGETLDDAPLGALAAQLAAAYDPRHGGFGGAPKFPRASDLDFLLRRKGDERARDMALATLAHMAEGGLYDQLGGGFCRYSVDAQWAIPHFEKMLYDNGLLLALYSDAWQLTGDSLYRRVVEETAAWAMREMQLPGGGYASSLDADSEGEEGRFYVWDRDEVRALVDAEAFAVAERHYGLDRPANFENRRWHLVVAEPLAAVAAALGLDAEEAAGRLARARAALFATRERRVRPGRDGKVLASWNALMIAAMARAARVFDRPDWLDSARRALGFVRAALWRDGRLLATSDGGPGRLDAYLDDHAMLVAALLELAQADFQAEDLAFATALADALLDAFEDRERGGFFFTRHDHEALIQRPKPLHDNAMPAGNAVAAWALGRLGHVTGDGRYLEAARRAVAWAYGALRRDPVACASFATALAETLAPPAVAVLRGPLDEVGAWRRRLDAKYRPDTLVFTLAPDAAPLPPALDKPLADHAHAWVCRGAECLAPIDDRDTLVGALGP